MRRHSVVTLMLLLAVAANAGAALSPKYADWARGPVQWIMLDSERQAWANVQTDSDASSFVDRFWARRDPTPATPANEFKAEFDARVEAANKEYGEKDLQGALTDFGRVRIVLGKPDRVSSRQTQSGTATVTEQDWTYAGLGVQMAFVEDPKNHWKLAGASAPDLLSRVNDSSIKQLQSDALRAAVAEMRNAKTNPYKSLYVTTGEYLTPDGRPFVPVQLYVPKSSGFDLLGEYTMFGTIEDLGGKVAAIIDEPAKLIETKRDLFVARSLALAPGVYRGTFGLAQGGKPLAMAVAGLVVTPMETSGVSPLLLSNDVYPLAEAQMPAEPFAFGGIRVVPKSDLTFQPGDELWYFFELRRPASETKPPAVKVRLTLNGKTRELTPDLVALKGVPGHYGVSQSFPLAGFPPGRYTMTLLVSDTTNNKTYDLQRDFRIAAGEAH